MQTRKRKRFVLAIAKRIKTDAARCQVFALQIDCPFAVTVTRHFQSLNKKFLRDDYFSLQTETENHKRKTSKNSSASFCEILFISPVDDGTKAVSFKYA